MKLADESEIADEAKVIAIRRAGVDLSLILIRAGDGEPRCYLNECRHLPQRLDLFGDRIVDHRSHELVCTAHGARFRLADGYCVVGPCQGSRLKRCTISVSGGEVFLESTPIDVFLGYTEPC